ncbi:hypothetical protein ACFQ1S_25800, partial [Kibdelosporangium lantanae]
MAVLVDRKTHHHQRPRLNHYQDHALVIAYAVTVTEKTGVLHAHELALFVTPHALVRCVVQPA